MAAAAAKTSVVGLAGDVTPPEENEDLTDEGRVSRHIVDDARARLEGELFHQRFCDEPSLEGERRRRRAGLENFDPAWLSDCRVEDLFEHDHAGWAPIHYVAFHGHVDSVDAMVDAVPALVDLRTADHLHVTPLMLAAMGNQMSVVRLLLQHGADITAVDRKNHGVVELCAFKQHLSIIYYLLSVQPDDRDKLAIWCRLVKMARRHTDIDAVVAFRTLKLMTEPPPEPTSDVEDDHDQGRDQGDDQGHDQGQGHVGQGEGGEEEGVPAVNASWKRVHACNFEKIVKLQLASNICDEAKVEAFDLLLNVLPRLEVRSAIVSAGIIPLLIELMTGENATLVRQASQTMRSLCAIPEYRQMAVDSDVFVSLTVAMRQIVDKDARVAMAQAIDSLVVDNREFQDAFCSTPDAVTSTMSLYVDCGSRSLLFAVTQAVCSAVRHNSAAQRMFVDTGVAAYISAMISLKLKELILVGIEAMHCLGEGNEATQAVLLGAGQFDPIIRVLSQTRYLSVQERTAGAVWALAGDNIEERQLMAERISVRLLIDFVGSCSPLLNLVGAEGLYALCTGPLGQHDNVAFGGGVPALIQLVRRPPPDGVPVIAGRPVEHVRVMLAALRAMQACCVAAGFVKYPHNQEIVCELVYGAMAALVGMLVDATQPALVRAETAHALGCVALGNRATARVVFRQPGFSFSVIVDLLEHEDRAVQTVSGAALAAFSYNIASNQRLIARCAAGQRLTFAHFSDMLRHGDELQRANAAFQMVILCRTFRDARPAEAACEGIKTLTKVMEQTKTSQTRVTVANFIAALCHTRPGLPDAFISVNIVEALGKQLTNPGEMVRGYAAIAVGYLTFNPIAKRQLLNICRVDPYVYRVIKHYTRLNKLSFEFIYGWRHYIEIGLAPVDPGRQSLIRKRVAQVFDEARPLVVSGENDRGLEPDPDEPTADEVDFPPRSTDADKTKTNLTSVPAVARKSRRSRLTLRRISQKTPGRRPSV